jgi:hypothetical protein
MTIDATTQHPKFFEILGLAQQLNNTIATIASSL